MPIISKELEIFDTVYFNVDRSEACDFIEQEIQKNGKVVYIAVKDVALTVRSMEDKFLSDFYKNIPTKIFVDGMGLIYAGKILNKKFKEMVGGPGIYYEILKRGENKGYSFYLLGSSNEILEKAIMNIRKRHPNIKICGFSNGYFNSTEEEDIVEVINNSRCDVLFLGISSPKREQFIRNNISKLRHLTCIAVGGVFDNEAGLTKFAPKLIAKIGMEWLYRVIQEPRRLAKRYFYTHTKFIFYLVKEILK